MKPVSIRLFPFLAIGLWGLVSSFLALAAIRELSNWDEISISLCIALYSAGIIPGWLGIRRLALQNLDILIGGPPAVSIYRLFIPRFWIVMIGMALAGQLLRFFPVLFWPRIGFYLISSSTLLCGVITLAVRVNSVPNSKRAQQVTPTDMLRSHSAFARGPLSSAVRQLSYGDIMMSESTKQQDNRIVIVGAGPVGLALALILARYDVPSLILESREAPTPSDESRAIVWMPKGLELLDWLGLAEQFAERGVRRTAHEFWNTEERLLTLSFTELDHPYRYSLQLPQHDTESLLEHAVLHTGLVEIRRRHQVVDVGERDGLAWVNVESPSGSYTFEADWAVGCDGANSQVRKSLAAITKCLQ